MTRCARLSAPLCVLFAVSVSLADTKPVELGRIDWLRKLDKAKAQSKSLDKPILILFDEVPGCQTCKDFGRGPLSHPIVVDAATELFVPVVIYNNVEEGPDRIVLGKYREPPWNNPVVRFLNARGTDLIPRDAGDYSTAGLLSRMVQARKSAGESIPAYLRLVNFEYNPSGRETATFAMHCYWVGEQKLGSLDGVLATRIGMLAGREVVELDFDPAIVSYEALVKKAKQFECADRVFARTDAQVAKVTEIVGDDVVRTDDAVDTSTTQQHHLAQEPAYHYLPLTQLQATRVNAAIASDQDPDVYLSPGQRRMKARIAKLIATDRDALEKLNVDRTPDGLPTYARKLSDLLTGKSDQSE